MLLPTDNIVLKKHGISAVRIEEQLNSFKNGFPFLKIQSIAEPENGIVQVTAIEISELLNHWEKYLDSNASILKFVPASGAASRMFKDLFEFLENKNDESENSFEMKFFDKIEKFAFYNDLNAACLKNNGHSITDLISNKKFKAIVENLLLEKGDRKSV